MLRFAFLCVILVLCRSMRAEPIAAAFIADDESEIQDLIYLSPGAPVFVRLRIRIDGSGFRTQRQAYASQLFDELDRSGDGVLTGPEIKAIPPAGYLNPFSGTAAKASMTHFAVPDADQIKQVTREELTTCILAVFGTTFQICTENRQPADVQPVQLFEQLDGNNDKQLTPEELSQAVRRLRLLDMDLDGRIAADEIRFPVDVSGVQQNNNAVTQEALAELALLEPVNRNHADDALIRKLIQKYDKLARGSANRRFTKDGRLSAAELGYDVDVVAASDQNKDGLLDPQELRRFVTDVQPATEILVEFGRESSGSRIELLKPGNLPQTATLEVDKNKAGDVIVRLGRTHFELAVNPQIWAAGPDRFPADFMDIDSDTNGFLDRDEFGQTADGVTVDHFRNVDRDGDGKVIEKEFTSFVNQQEELQKHLVCLELDGSGQSLFRIIDSSGDGRLDTSELATLPSRILAMDSNSDGVVTEDELPGGFRIMFSRSNCR